MKYNQIGKSGLKVSLLGLGCWEFGRGNYWRETSQKDTDAVVSAALDEGVNYFDTAEVYNDGESETALGLSLRSRRHKAVIGSKISTSNALPGILRRHCEDSLKRLKTDYIDIYMLHWPLNRISMAHFIADKNADINPPEAAEVFGILSDLRREGKIREIGLSNHGVKQMSEILPFADISVNELPYNLLSRAIEPEIIPYCKKNGLAVFGYMAYMQGILTGKYKSIREIPAPQAHSRHFRQERGGDLSRHREEGAEEEIEALLTELYRLSYETELSQATLALAWTVRDGMIASTLTGSGSLANLHENIRAVNTSLSEDIINELDRLSRPVWDKLGDNADYYENRNNGRIY